MKPPHASLRLLGIVLLVTLLPWAAVPTLAADPPPKGEDIADLRAATDEAIKKWSMGITTAFDELIKAREWDREQAENIVSALKQQLPNARMENTKAFGQPIPREYEFLGTMRTGEHDILFSYLLKHEWSSYPIHLRFIRLDAKWRFIDVSLGKSAMLMARRFFKVERPETIRFDATPNANPFKPASLSDLKHACDAAMTRIAAGDKTGFFTDLMKEHFVSPADVADQISTLESRFQLAQAQLLADIGQPLPGKSEFLGLIALGTNRANLYYSIPYEQGTATWTCFLYKPGRAWRLLDIKRNAFTAEEKQLLFPARPATEPLLPAQRPMAEMVERMAAAMAQSSPTAMDEMFRKGWIHRDNPEKLATTLQTWPAMLPAVILKYGQSQPIGTMHLGSIAHGNQTIELLHVHLRERGVFPVSSLLTLRNSKWWMAQVKIEETAYDSFKPFIHYERRTPPPTAPAKQSKPAPSDITALEKSCAQFMTRVTEGKVSGAFAELIQQHPAIGKDVSFPGSSEEANFQAQLVKMINGSGQPVKGKFEYLGVGRCEPFLARLVYQQYFYGGTMPWVFDFYRVNNEWRTAHVPSPEDSSADLQYLQVIERASPEALPK